MSAVILLFLVGIVLVAIEVLVPGGLLGILGGGAMLAGVIIAFVEFGLKGGSYATFLALLIGAITLYLEFVLLPKSRFVKALSMGVTNKGCSQPEIAVRTDVVGREATAVTTLAPTGYVELDGRRYEAACQSGLASVGSRLRVVDVDNFRLIVTQIKTSS